MPRLRTLSLGLFLEVVALSFIETEGVPCGGEDVFVCTNLTCIPLHWRCDGENDCGDNSDEDKCPEVTCTPLTQFSCGGGHCIPKRWVCDRDEDCNDGSDEPADCAKRTCSPTEYKCGNGRCIPQRWLCDHEDDCGDNSDEKNCRNVTCKSDEYMCKNKKCITKQWVCDYDNDCGDHSDEEKCPPHTCKSSEFTCLNKRCIRSDWKCDGDNDCKDNSDELGCPSLSPHCSDNEVQCNTGECIHKGWWCDGEVDCHNGTDEKDCSKHCHKSQFECKNTRCVSLTKVCNGKNDCHDNSDEQDCPEPTLPVCPQGQFQCGSDDQCIDEQKVCNKYSDCKNGADEPKSCNENECLKNNGGCQHMCNDTLTSYFCSCKRGYQVNRGNRNKCTDVNECLEFGACSQICENTKGSFKCSCLDGYKLEPDDRTCKAVGPEGFLIFANRQDLRRIRLDSSDYTELVGQQRAAIAVDFHAHKATIFWSDVMNEEIRRAPLGNGSAVTSVIKTGLHTPDGIAVDWVNDMIYWTDTGNDNIEVAGLNGLGRLTLISDGLDEPRAIALYPGIGYMYWTDWGETAKIERCGMNGDPETRKVIVSSNILWPNAITIDLTLDKIWWADAKLHTIEAADLDGSNRIIILGEDIFHPFGLTLFQDYMYWTDWQKDSIYRANKFTGKGKSVVGDNLFSPMDLQLYHFQRQPKSINPCAKRLCSHICLLAPRPLGSTCHCEPGVKLLGDGKTCNTSGAFECQENRCKNNGTCVSKENATVLPKCLCLSEFTGDRCQYRIASGGGGIGDGNTVATRVSSNDKESESIGTTVGIAIGVVLGILIISLIVGYFIYRRIKKQSYTPDRPGSSVYKRTTESTTSLDAERSLKFDSLNKGNSFKVYFSKSSRGRNDQALLSDVGNDS